MFRVLFAEIDSNLESVFSTLYFWKNFIVIFFNTFISIALYLIFSLIVPGLRDEVKKCRGMLKLIPIEIFTSNSLVKRTVMKHKTSKLYSVKGK